MPTSKKRGGKKKHQKRVSNRNENIKVQTEKAQKYQKEMFDQMMEQYEKEMSAKKVADETMDPNQIEGLDGPEI